MKHNALRHDQPLLKVGFNALLSAILGLGAITLAFFSLFGVREIVVWGLTYLLIEFNPELQRYQIAAIINTAHQCAVVLMGLVGLVVAIAIVEYVLRYAGQPRVLRLLVKIILVESALVLPVLLIFWRQ